MTRRLLPLLALLAGCATEADVAPSRETLRPGDPFPHALWTDVLRRHSRDGLVDYPALAADRAGLDAYLGWLARHSPASDPDLFPRREDRLAWLINAYNACTVRGVVDRWPITSVRDAGPTGTEFWTLTSWPLGGRPRTLRQLEDEIRTFGDPRIHFAINCASLGCPRLPDEAFEPDRLESQLEREARAFVADGRNVRVEGDALVLSKIFQWYRREFEEFQEARGGAPDLADYVRSLGAAVPAGAELEFGGYDWGINLWKRGEERR